ncbi:mechanosensitive ion channel family protein [Kitasatospora sp. NPDC057015]|uniref:mechanosensitive ion channel family protein n=1 Tax=Kitasatospora sp. NPDC057015 TaxID=3346001 RepID=UPI00363EE2E1
MQIWSIVRPLAVVIAVLVVILGLDRLIDRLLGRLSDRRPGSVLWPLLRRCRAPFLAAAVAFLLLTGEPAMRLPEGVRPAARHGLLLAVLVTCGWLAARVVSLVIDTGLRSYATDRRDPARIRRVRTQAGLMGRICDAGIAVVTLAAVLMTFPAVRAVGTSLLASAGLVGLVVGVAAQSTLANLFAGIQLAFGDQVRIGDVVVVSGEWGTVEEITLTAVVIATWDQRRIVMPVSHFAGKPFENWSRGGSGITGTAILHLDHSTPLAELREEFGRRLAGNERWDGEGWALQVVDTTPSTLVVRLLMTARSGEDAFELRCWAREELIGYLREQHPHALPKVALAAAAGPGGERPERAGHGPSAVIREAFAEAAGGSGSGSSSGSGGGHETTGRVGPPRAERAGGGAGPGAAR